MIAFRSDSSRLESFGRLMQNSQTSIKESNTGKGVLRIFLFGEIEIEREKKSLAQGIELSAATVGRLNHLLGRAHNP